MWREGVRVRDLSRVIEHTHTMAELEEQCAHTTAELEEQRGVIYDMITGRLPTTLTGRHLIGYADRIGELMTAPLGECSDRLPDGPAGVMPREVRLHVLHTCADAWPEGCRIGRGRNWLFDYPTGPLDTDRLTDVIDEIARGILATAAYEASRISEHDHVTVVIRCTCPTWVDGSRTHVSVIVTLAIVTPPVCLT